MSNYFLFGARKTVCVLKTRLGPENEKGDYVMIIFLLTSCSLFCFFWTKEILSVPNIWFGRENEMISFLIEIQIADVFLDRGKTDLRNRIESLSQIGFDFKNKKFARLSSKKCRFLSYQSGVD